VKNLDREAKMLADIRILYAKVQELHNGVNVLRKNYGEGELLKFADSRNLRECSAKLQQIVLWLQAMQSCLGEV